MKKLMIGTTLAFVGAFGIAARGEVVEIGPGETHVITADNIATYKDNQIAINGGTLDLNGNSLPIAGLSGTNAESLVKDSVGGSVLTVTQAEETSFAGRIDASVTLVKNGTATATYVLRDLGSFRARGGTTVFAGGAITNEDRKLTIGNDTYTSATVSFTGGQHKIMTASEDSSFGIGYSGTGTLKVSGDDTVVLVNIRKDSYFGNTGQSTVDVSGGALYLRHEGKSSGVQLYQASQPGATSTWRISGGLVDCDNTLITSRGAFDYLQSGGTVRFANFQLEGNAQGKDKSISFRVTGGKFTADTAIKVGTNGEHYYTVGVSDAVMEMPGMAGGTKGTRAFSADSAVFKATASTISFLQGFDTAEIGAGGITFDTGYNITVAQDFAFAEGVTKCRLLKKGKGTLTLSGALPSGMEIVIEEGVVVFAGAHGYVAAGLTLGTSASSGGIQVNAGATLKLQSAPVIWYDCSPKEYDFVPDGEGGYDVIEDSAGAKTIEIRLDEAVVSNATEDVAFRPNDTLKATVASGGLLNLKGCYFRGILEKDGAGRAVVSNPDDYFTGGVLLNSGLLGFAVWEPFAFSAGIRQTGGTLAFCAPEEGTANTSYTLVTPADNAAAVIKTDVDTTIRGAISVSKGAIIKRGAGKLTLNSTKDVTLSLGHGVNGLSRTVMSFDEDGTPPTTGYAGFNVAEGEVELTGGKTYTINHTAHVGMNLDRPAAAKPTLTIRNASLMCGNTGTQLLFIGGALTAESPVQECALNVYNSTVSGGSTPFCVGGNGDATSTSPTSRVDVVIDNSTLSCTFGYLMNKNVSGGKAYWTFRNDSNLYMSDSTRNDGYAAVEFESGTTAAKDSSLGRTYIGSNAGGNDSGYWRFNTGSKAYINGFNGFKSTQTIALRFNGGEWHPSGRPTLNGFTKEKPTTSIKTEIESNGVIAVVDSGTVRNTLKLQGEGAFTKKGAGTFVFDTQATVYNNVEFRFEDSTKADFRADKATWTFTGGMNVEEGAVVVSNGAISASVAAATVLRVAPSASFTYGEGLADATLSGGGTFAIAGLTNATFKASVDAAGAITDVPTFASSRLGGTLIFDFGRTAENPLARDSRVGMVARWTGVKPTDVKFLAVNTGLNAKGRFTVNDDGTITADLRPRGFAIILR